MILTTKAKKEIHVFLSEYTVELCTDKRRETRITESLTIVLYSCRLFSGRAKTMKIRCVFLTSWDLGDSNKS